MDAQRVEELESELRDVNEKLRLTQNKFESVIDLVYRTFNGDGPASLELSKIVGVPPPILYCDDEESQEKAKFNGVATPSYKETNSRFNNRLEFLNQVMSDHDKMMMNNYAKPASSKRINSASHNNRTKSADRLVQKGDRSYFNPYTWSLNEHTGINMNIFRHNVCSPTASCMAKPLQNKSTKSRPETRQNPSHGVKVEDFLNHSTNRRSVKSSSAVKLRPPHNDFKLMSDSEVTISRPPKASRPTSSLTYSRGNSAKTRMNAKISSPYYNLNLQSMSESDNSAEQLLKAMEKRFELSTIDLQRRLGISQAGMVGP